MWDGGEDVRPKYLGGDMVLLMGLSDTRAEDLCREEDESGLSMFHTLEKWSPTMKSGFRLVWVLCWGVPFHAWDMENIKKIVGVVGEVVDIDDDVADLQRLDRARVLIKTPWHPTINHKVLVSINEVEYIINIVEETCYNPCRC